MAATQTDNATDTAANAADYVNKPDRAGLMDFYPKIGSALHASKMALSSVSSDVDYDLRLQRHEEGLTYRGAYSGEM